MTDDRWTRIERIYFAALEQPACDRAAFVRREAGGDVELVAEIEGLLAYDDRPAAFAQHSAIDLAARAIAAERVWSSERDRSGAIGAYEVLRPLGAGGMGYVYLAHDGRLARNVALKVLRPDLADTDWITAFREEAVAASALNHPNILTIHEIGEHDGTRFIASEYVDGETLRERVKRGPLPEPELIDIALQITDGLAAAHDAGVVHRDIKPENVMVRADGLVKILDFGIATRTGHQAARVPTAGGVVIGTTGYMSPEQRRGLTVDARTDVWSLGIVIFEMATGCKPAAAGVDSNEFSRLSPNLARIVSRALSAEREQRYSTARELAAELRALRRTLEVVPTSGGRSRTRFAAAVLILVPVIYLLTMADRSRKVSAGSAVEATDGADETRSPVAYQLYAKGRYHVLRRTPSDLRKGLEYLREAIELDPNYARAYAKLADAHILLAMTSDVAPKESFPHAKTAAARALTIDPELAEARVSMGIIKFWFDWDWGGAEAEFKRAIAAQRPDPSAHTFYGHLLSNLGDHTGALQQMRRALDYEPHSALANALFAQCLYYERRYDESLAHLQKTLDLDPSLWLTYNMIGRIYGVKQMYGDALQAFAKASELGGSLIVRASAGYTLAASGRREEAREILDELTRRAAQGYVPPSNFALVHLGLGEHELALDRLEEAVDARDLLLTFLTVEPRWAGLAGQTRFTTVLGRVGLKQ
jgi:serine/threonine protein kinase/Flp pilus assembly protein TadD